MAVATATKARMEELRERFTMSHAPLDLDGLAALDTASETYPKEVDHSIAAAQAPIFAAEKGMALVHKAAKKAHVRSAEARAKGNDFMADAYHVDAVAYEAKYDRAVIVRQAAVEAAAPYVALYTGWTRFFLVCNLGGHVHNTLDCSTCYVTTQFSWLPELSGADDDSLIDHVGTTVCTVCYPDAPTDARYAAAAKAEAEAAAEGICEHSGTYHGSVNPNRVCRPGVRCECGSFVTLTAGGSLPKHVTPAVAAAAKDEKRIAKNISAGKCEHGGAVVMPEAEVGYDNRPKHDCECGKRVTVTSNGKIPSHKAA